MASKDLRSLDIALATEARGMATRLLTAEEKEKLKAMRSTAELLNFLSHSPGWGPAIRELPDGEATDRQFSEVMERQVYREYEKLYRFAEDTSKDFLRFIAMRVKLQAILSTLRRLGDPDSDAFSDPLPPFFHRLPRYTIDKIVQAESYDELVEASAGIYHSTLEALEINPLTGLPRYAEAADLLEDHYYSALSGFLDTDYDGPDKKSLKEILGFRADMLNISYLLRLRRFHTPPDKARELLIPLSGSLSRETEDAVLAAETDEKALAVILASPLGKQLKGLEAVRPERFVRTAEYAYFRKILRGPPTLSSAYAFMVLKEAECDMFRRVFVTVQYGANPEQYL